MPLTVLGMSGMCSILGKQLMTDADAVVLFDENSRASEVMCSVCITTAGSFLVRNMMSPTRLLPPLENLFHAD